jgi:hypothetical protein
MIAIVLARIRSDVWTSLSLSKKVFVENVDHAFTVETNTRPVSGRTRRTGADEKRLNDFPCLRPS